MVGKVSCLAFVPPLLALATENPHFIQFATVSISCVFLVVFKFLGFDLINIACLILYVVALWRFSVKVEGPEESWLNRMGCLCLDPFSCADRLKSKRQQLGENSAPAPRKDNFENEEEAQLLLGGELSKK